MDLLKTYVACTKQKEKRDIPENYQCSYYKTLEDVNKFVKKIRMFLKYMVQNLFIMMK